MRRHLPWQGALLLLLLCSSAVRCLDGEPGSRGEGVAEAEWADGEDLDALGPQSRQARAAAIKALEAEQPQHAGGPDVRAEREDADVAAASTQPGSQAGGSAAPIGAGDAGRTTAAQPVAPEATTAAATAAAAQPGEGPTAAAAAAAPQPGDGHTAAAAAAAQGGGAEEAYVAICAAVKDQHIDVREWIFYHRAIGVDKFYLTDTGSSPPMQTVIQDYMDIGLVDYTYDTAVPARKGTHGPQITIYERCLDAHGSKHAFMLFIDVDEFVILRDATPDLPSLLRDYEPYGGLVLNWVVFGSSGLQERPAGNTLSSYWRCAEAGHPENRHVKSAVRPARVREPTTDPHHFFYTEPYYAVNSRHERVKGPKSDEVVLERVALNHYAIKSVADFRAKMARGSGMGNVKTMAYLEYVDNFTTADCYDAIDVGLRLEGFAVY